MVGVLLVGLSVGLSNFAASIGIGVSGVDGRMRWRIGLAFGFFETLMPIVGLLIGEAIAGSVAGIGRYVGAALLILTGAYVLWKGRQGKELVEPRAIQMGVGQLMVTAFALSLDNLVIGFALSFYRVPLLIAAGVIGVMSVSMSLIGLELGQRLGQRFEQWSEELGGGVLILVGCTLALGVFK
jgi:manganese efflux pump family protein